VARGDGSIGCWPWFWWSAIFHVRVRVDIVPIQLREVALSTKYFVLAQREIGILFRAQLWAHNLGEREIFRVVLKKLAVRRGQVNKI
jgi:hypothetical protein